MEKNTIDLESNFYICSYIGDSTEYSYVSNLDPLCWSNSMEDAKKYYNILDAKKDIYNYLREFQNTIWFTDTNLIFVYSPKYGRVNVLNEKGYIISDEC